MRCHVAFAIMGCAVLAATSVPAQAAVVFDNLANLGNPYLASVGFGAIPVPGYFLYIAEGFVPSGNYQLQSLELPLFVTSYTPNNAQIAVMDDVGGLPASVLESFQVANLPTTSPAALTTVISQMHPLLTDGSRYWIAVTGGTSTSFGGWDLVSGTGLESNKEILNGVDLGWNPGDPGNPALALRVDGDPVPEPGTALLFAAGVCLFAIIGRLRRTPWKNMPVKCRLETLVTGIWHSGMVGGDTGVRWSIHRRTNEVCAVVVPVAGDPVVPRPGKCNQQPLALISPQQRENPPCIRLRQFSRMACKEIFPTVWMSDSGRRARISTTLRSR